MATDKDKKGTESAAPADEAQSARAAANARAAYAPGAVLTTPIILTRSSGKKRKKYSRGSKGAQRLLYGISRAGYRISDSFTDGLDTFVSRSKKSSRKRRDGMIRDSLRNASRGLSDGIQTLSKAPDEIARRFPTRAVWRTFRVITPFGN